MRGEATEGWSEAAEKPPAEQGCAMRRQLNCRTRTTLSPMNVTKTVRPGGVP